MNVNHPNTRGMAFSIYNLADGLGERFRAIYYQFFYTTIWKTMGILI